MKKLFSLSILLFYFLSTSCSKNDTESVYLRMINHTGKDLSSIKISFNHVAAQYNSVLSGDTSNYQKLEKIYSYGWVKAKTDSLTLESAHPIDYVGESPIKNGKYNGIVTYSNDGYHGFLILTIEQD